MGDITHISKEVNGTPVLKAEYSYDAWGNHETYVLNNGSYVDILSQTKYIETGLNNKAIAEINPFRYRGYYYDQETGLYYLQTRYYGPETGRFINADALEYLDKENINGLNLYAYFNNNPIMMIDSTGCAPWWNWLISGLQFVAGVALCFVPGAQGIGLSLAIGGGLGLIANAVAPAIGQAIGGASSLANGWGALSAGMSILGLGIPGLIGGLVLMAVGGATMAFGANEIVGAATGKNYIQQWTGMSDAAYRWTYFGLNLASSLGQMAGNAYRLHQTRTPRIGRTGELNGYRYADRKGNLLYDFDKPHGNIDYDHYHGIPSGIMANRTKGHWSYLRLIWWSRR